MEMRIRDTLTRGKRYRLAIAALFAALAVGLLTLANAQAATDAPGEPAVGSGPAAVTDLAEPAQGGCVGEFAVTSGGGVFAEFDLSFWHYGVAHWQYPDANGNCPSGWSKQSVYNCTYDEDYNVTCGYEDRCYPSNSGS